MDKNEIHIMVVDAEKVNGFQGFSYRGNHEEIILQSFFYLRRGDAEINPKFKQPIPYVLLLNKQIKSVYIYRRSSKKKESHEERLHGNWSFGIGGHIEKKDASGNPIRDALLRELREETTVKDISEIALIGYINDDSNDVGKVHFGMLYAAFTSDTNIAPNDSENVEGRLMHIDHLREICRKEKVENWSLIALEPLEILMRE